MNRTMLIPVLLIPCLAGCIWSEDRGRHEEHRDHHEARVVQPEHVHCVGCGHVLRGGIWVAAD